MKQLDRWASALLIATTMSCGAGAGSPDNPGKEDAAEDTGAPSDVAQDTRPELAPDAEAEVAADGGLLPSAPAQVASGYDHACTRTVEGRVRCWGSNKYGELGNGTTINSWAPTPEIASLTGVASVFSGYYVSAALMLDGTIRVWGNLGLGELGDGKLPGPGTVKAPRTVPGVTTSQLAVGHWHHLCAITNDRGLVCWGWNKYGQLGYSTSSTYQASATPTPVPGLTAVEQVSGGASHTCAVVGKEKQAWCWGDNADGALGDGTTVSRTTPEPVSGLSGVKFVSAGPGRTCALKEDGKVFCWGVRRSNSSGTYDIDTVPVLVKGFAAAVAEIATGAGFTCARLATGAVQCWGDGAPASGFSKEYSATPVTIAGVTNTIQISASATRTCAVRDDGTIRCWGVYAGDGMEDYKLTPTLVKW